MLKKASVPMHYTHPLKEWILYQDILKVIDIHALRMYSNVLKSFKSINVCLWI